MKIEHQEMEATLEELVRFENFANAYQRMYPKERSTLTFALIKQSKRYKVKREDLGRELNLEMEAVKSRHASVDKDENIIEEKFDVKQGKGDDNTVLRMKYKKEAKVKMDKELEDLQKSYQAKLVTIQPPYALVPFFIVVPKNFDFNFMEPFKKFIFNPEMTEDQELEIYLAQKPEDRPTVLSVLNGQ
jgi:hypothetical protein